MKRNTKVNWFLISSHDFNNAIDRAEYFLPTRASGISTFPGYEKFERNESRNKQQHYFNELRTDNKSDETFVIMYLDNKTGVRIAAHVIRKKYQIAFYTRYNKIRVSLQYLLW